jgi:NAD(P)-dependent dehydrogenase (short-subunit alcohol dehydrogenase family)
VTYDANGKRVLVTGGSSGIGAALAERLAAAGATVALTARREDRLAEVLERCRKHSPDSQSFVCDMVDPAQVNALAGWAVDDFGGVDMLVNNAGIPKRRHVTKLDQATVEHVMRVNYLAPVQLTLALLPHLLARDNARIINVSSVAATLSSPGETAYSASKAALAVFSEAMAVDLWDSSIIKMLIVYPGVVDTELFTIPDNDPLPDAIPKITVDEMVDGIIDALDRDALEVYVPGWFKDLVTNKVADPQQFLSGTAEWVRTH